MILYISNKDVDRAEYILSLAAMGFEGDGAYFLLALVDQIQEEKLKTPYTMYLRKKEKENDEGSI